MRPLIYLLNNALTGIGRGGYPQIQKMSPNYDYSARVSISKLMPIRFPDFQPNLNSFVLMKGATPTDLISGAPIPYFTLLVSNKLRKILVNFKLPQHKIYPAGIIHNDQNLEDYSIIHFLENKEDWQYIDFNRSRFWLQENGHKNIELINLTSPDDLKSAEKEARSREPAAGIWAEDLVMQDKFYETFDLFLLASITFPIVFKITEKLRKAIEEEKCTGISLQCVSENKEKLVDYLSNSTITYFP